MTGTRLSDLAVEVADVAAIAERRDEILAAVRAHAGEIAANVARIDGGDYGRRSFSTDRGEWTVKHEAGELEFLLYEPRGGGKIYVVSTRSPAEPEALSRALSDYESFVSAYGEYVASLDGALDDIDDDFPTVESTAPLAAERDRLVDRIECYCERIAGELHRQEGTEYGTFAARVDGTRWALKRDGSSASYLRVGGSDGVYLLSQYGPPAATDVRNYAPQFGGFVRAYNRHVAELESDLARIDLRS
jgi:hypothetical protein